MKQIKVVIRTIEMRGTPEDVASLLEMSLVPNAGDIKSPGTVEIRCTSRTDWGGGCRCGATE
jgi:hypothetical protein